MVHSAVLHKQLLKKQWLFNKVELTMKILLTKA